MTHTRLVFLRHGQTEWNLLGKLQGQADIDLDEVGEQQAVEAARFFQQWSFAACYTSDLKRALRTAQIVATPHGIDAVPDARLREINVGTWSGLTAAEASAELPRLAELYNRGIDFRRSPAGETQAEMVRRALPAMHEIMGQHEGQQILIVTHGLLLASIVAALVGGRDDASMLGIPDNTCYSTVTVRGGKPWLMTHNAPTTPVT